MNIIYFKSKIGNFGDDLNAIIWKKLFGNLSDYKEDLDFVGIGSIIDERILSNNETIVFGSGVREIDIEVYKYKDVNFDFVRGPLSSKILNNVPYITDSAYFLRLIKDEDEIVQKKYKISFIPYFRHFNNFNRILFEKLTGIHIISPSDSVDKVISEIKSSEKIIAGAMHGAILADIYRVPWARAKFPMHGYENNLTSELKWNDWCLSINKNEIPTIYFDYDLNRKIRKIDYPGFFVKSKRRMNTIKGTLSDENVLLEIEKKLNLRIESFIKKYKNR